MRDSLVFRLFFFFQIRLTIFILKIIKAHNLIFVKLSVILRMQCLHNFLKNDKGDKFSYKMITGKFTAVIICSNTSDAWECHGMDNFISVSCFFFNNDCVRKKMFSAKDNLLYIYNHYKKKEGKPFLGYQTTNDEGH